MPYFKDQAGALHFLSSDDVARGCAKVLPVGCQQIADADALTLLQPAAPTGNAAIKAHIVALEETVTARRSREAMLGIDGGWLASINSQIAALRAQLT